MFHGEIWGKEGTNRGGSGETKNLTHYRANWWGESVFLKTSARGKLKEEKTCWAEQR